MEDGEFIETTTQGGQQQTGKGRKKNNKKTNAGMYGVAEEEDQVKIEQDLKK